MQRWLKSARDKVLGTGICLEKIPIGELLNVDQESSTSLEHEILGGPPDIRRQLIRERELPREISSCSFTISKCMRIWWMIRRVMPDSNIRPSTGTFRLINPLPPGPIKMAYQ